MLLLSRHLLVLSLVPLTLGAQPDATIHQEYRYQLPNPKLTWTPVAGMPSGLRIIPESAEIWGAPNEAGQFTFALQASDGSQLTLKLKVNALWNLSLTPPQAAVGVAFSHAQVVGGGTPPYTYSASGLAPGLAISRGGVISGTPTTAGTYSGTVVASDSAGNYVNLPYTLTVNPLGIVTTSLPPIEAGKPYSQQLVATGGKPPYTWSLLDGFVPCAGLDQRPVLPPSTEGTFEVSVLFALTSEPPPESLSPDGILTVDNSVQYSTLCVQVADSGGNKAKADLAVNSLAPDPYPLQAHISPRLGEISVGDPVYMTVYEDQGTFPFIETPLLLPPGFVFYPDQSIIFGYPQTPGNYTILFQVKDGSGATVICESSFTVSPIRVGSANLPAPVFGKPYAEQFYAVNGAVPYSWTLAPGDPLPAGLTFSSTGLVSGTPLETPPYHPTGRVTDSLGNARRFSLPGLVSAGTPVTLYISSNDTPFLTLNRVSSYRLSASGTLSTFTWTVKGALPPGMIEQDNPDGSLTFWGVPTVAGSYALTVQVTDAKGNTSIRLIPLRVTELHSDSRTLPVGVTNVMSQIQLNVAGGTPPYQWSVATGSQLPAGMNLSPSGLFSGTPSNAGYSTFTATVSDSNRDTVNLNYTWQVDGLEIPAAQVPSALPAGQPFSLQLQALGGTPPFTWSLPYPDCQLGGLTLSPGGLLSGTPSGSGSVGCVVIVTDARGNSAPGGIAFYIGEAPPPLPPPHPQILGPIFSSASVGDLLSTRLSILAVTPSVSAAPGSSLPPGLTADGQFLSGYPTKAGDYAFQIQVTDAYGLQATARAYVHVSPLHILPFLASGIYNQPYSSQLRILEQQKPVLWSLAPNSRIPAGLMFSPDGLLSGIPAETGTFNFTVRANDASARLSLAIACGATNTYNLARVPTIALPVGGGTSLYLYGGLPPYGEPYTFSISSGALPPGMQLSPGGVISGTLTTAGIYTFTVRVDGYKGFGVSAYTIRVGVMEGETRTLPTATVGQPYAAQLKGGTLAPGDSLPPGLTLSPDGKLSGTPTNAFLYQFSTVLTDATGDSVTSSYTLEVLPAAN